MRYREIEQYKYQLVDDEVVILNWSIESAIDTPYIHLKGNVLKVTAGYLWDGSSGPTVDTESTMRGSLFHDALYQLMRSGLLPQGYKHHADNLYHDLIVEDGMSKWRAWMHFNGVKHFGRNSCEVQESTSPKVIEI